MTFAATVYNDQGRFPFRAIPDSLLHEGSPDKGPAILDLDRERPGAHVLITQETQALAVQSLGNGLLRSLASRPVHLRIHGFNPMPGSLRGQGSPPLWISTFCL